MYSAFSYLYGIISELLVLRVISSDLNKPTHKQQNISFLIL